MAKFQFKRFAVRHEAAAMKVGMDGVTLGAWARCDGRVLDAGCGCGLIGLMAAQRGASGVVMVEIDPGAAREAAENAAESPWSDIVETRCGDFLTLSEDEKFDNIISNPPFFANGELAPDPARAAARHQGNLTPQAFMTKAARLLASEGSISVIIPSDLSRDWEFAARLAGLHCRRRVALFTRKRATEPRRLLLEFGNVSSAGFTPEETSLNIHLSDYQNLVNDFYL